MSTDNLLTAASADAGAAEPSAAEPSRATASAGKTSEGRLSATPRTALRRHKERARTDRGDLYAILDSGLICHLGVVIDGVPIVLPTAYGRRGDVLYLHGSSANRSLLAANGQEVCVTVTHLDGIVCARAVFNHSINYRSAVIFGTARLVTDEQQRLDGLRIITEQLIPGRWAVARQPTRKEMAATAVLEIPLADASVKVRTGPPADDPADYALDVWAGVVPAALTFGEQQPDPTLAAQTSVPAHIKAIAGRARG